VRGLSRTLRGPGRGAPPACVIGDVDVVSALGRAGIRSAVVAKPGAPSRYSRYAAARVEWADPWRAPETLVRNLLAYAAEQPAPPILYYDADGDLLTVSRNRDKLGKAFRFVIGDAELVEDLVDKSRFQALAERLDLPIPRAVRLSASAEHSELDLRFPAVAKPLTRRAATWGSLADAKALRVADPAGLREAHARFAAVGVDTLVQEEVPGPKSRIESYHVYVDEDGLVAGEFTGRKLRTYPLGYGYSTALEISDEADVATLGRELVERIGLRGVAKVDFKRDDHGRLYLLEVNPRFNLWHHPGAAAGVNLPALVYADLAGLPRPARRSARVGVRWCSLAHDHAAARGAGVPLLAWARWTIGCEAKSGFSLRDPFPLPRSVLWRVARRFRGRRGGALPDGAAAEGR
jgi:D-aspartate ligase